MGASRTLELLKEAGTVIVTELAVNLLKSKPHSKKASGGLIGSLKSSVETTSDGFSLVVTGADYAKWVDRGREKKSRRVPISALVKWITQKGLETGDKKKLALAWAIQTSIYQNGIKPTNFIQKSLDSASVKLENKVLEGVFIDVSSNIDELLNKYVPQNNTYKNGKLVT